MRAIWTFPRGKNGDCISTSWRNPGSFCYFLFCISKSYSFYMFVFSSLSPLKVHLMTGMWMRSLVWLTKAKYDVSHTLPNPPNLLPTPVLPTPWSPRQFWRRQRREDVSYKQNTIRENLHLILFQRSTNHKLCVFGRNRRLREPFVLGGVVKIKCLFGSWAYALLPSVAMSTK